MLSSSDSRPERIGKGRSGEAYGLSKKAGLKHVTYLSVFKADQFLEVPHFAAKNAIEEAIRAGRMPYTILRPGYFVQNERGLKPVLTGPGVYPIPAGNQGLAVVDVRDIAEAAAISLTEEGHKGKTYDLVSSEMLTGPDAAATWSKLLGKEITYAGHGDFDDFESTTAENRESHAEYRDSQLAGLRSSAHVPGFCRAWIHQRGGPDGALCCLARAPAENVQQLRSRTSNGVGCSVSRSKLDNDSTWTCVNREKPISSSRSWIWRLMPGCDT